MAHALGKLFGWILIIAFCLAVVIFGGRAAFAIGAVLAPWIVGFLIVKTIWNKLQQAGKDQNQNGSPKSNTEK